MDDVINEIINLESLESLKIDCQAVSAKNFCKIFKMDSLKSLHLEIQAQSHWLLSALSAFAFKSITKLSLDISKMEITEESLKEAMKFQIVEFHLKTSLKTAMNAVFSNPACVFLEVFSIEYAPNTRYSSSYRDIRGDFNRLRSLTIINKVPGFASSTRDIAHIIPRFPRLQKLHIEGYYITENLHYVALKSCNSTLEELKLISDEQTFVIPGRCADLLRRCKRLNKMMITCEKNFYFDYKRFPVIKCIGSEVIFCQN